LKRQIQFIVVALVASIIFAAIVNGSPIQPQTKVAGKTRSSFEVVSIKPNNSRSGSSSSSYRPGGVYIATNVSLKFMVTEAYGIQDFQLLGGPSWIDSDRFNVEAKPEAATLSTDYTRDQLLALVQSMLEDRFQLKFHRETRELPIYALVIGKEPPKLTPSSPEKSQQCATPGGCTGTSMHCCADGVMDLSAIGVSLSTFAETIGQVLRRPVTDKTGLGGVYDIKLQWLREDIIPNDAFLPGPSIFTAVQEQLGLRLTSDKGPVEVMVIDGVQKPTEN